MCKWSSQPHVLINIPYYSIKILQIQNYSACTCKKFPLKWSIGTAECYYPAHMRKGWSDRSVRLSLSLLSTEKWDISRFTSPSELWMAQTVKKSAYLLYLLLTIHECDKIIVIFIHHAYLPHLLRPKSCLMSIVTAIRSMRSEHVHSDSKWHPAMNLKQPNALKNNHILAVGVLTKRWCHRHVCYQTDDLCSN